jgi:predicted nucleic acid-binding protein
MTKLVLDSDLLSDLLRNGNPNVTAKAAQYRADHNVLTFTSLSTLEILSGLRHIQASAQIRRAEALFADNDEICPEVEDYRLAAEIIGALLRAGTPVGFVDPAIAACAIRRGYGVASGNVAHFGFIRNAGYRFHLENWRGE